MRPSASSPRLSAKSDSIAPRLAPPTTTRRDPARRTRATAGSRAFQSSPVPAPPAPTAGPPPPGVVGQAATPVGRERRGDLEPLRLISWTHVGQDDPHLS